MESQTLSLGAVGGFMLLVAAAHAVPVAYTSETLFLDDLATLGFVSTHEGFEDDAAWGGVRNGGSNTAASVTSRHVIWSSNNQSSNITTGNGAARTGEWGLYSLPHGSYLSPDPGADPNNPGECGDGLRGRAETGALVGIGGWFDTNTPPAKIGLFLGVYPNNPVGFGETCPGNGGDCTDNAILAAESKFFGVIDAAGFTAFEYRELEGTLGDQKYIFADDFYFAISGPSSVRKNWPLYR